jgi:hypothetical protein
MTVESWKKKTCTWNENTYEECNIVFFDLVMHSVLVISPSSWQKYTWGNNLREERFILSHCFKVFWPWSAVYIAPGLWQDRNIMVGRHDRRKLTHLMETLMQKTRGRNLRKGSLFKDTPPWPTSFRVHIIIYCSAMDTSMD